MIGSARTWDLVGEHWQVLHYSEVCEAWLNWNWIGRGPLESRTPPSSTPICSFLNLSCFSFPLGISWTTQFLLLITHITRNLNLFFEYTSIYHSSMKAFLILSSLYTVWLIGYKYKWAPGAPKWVVGSKGEEKWSWSVLIIGVCAIIAFINLFLDVEVEEISDVSLSSIAFGDRHRPAYPKPSHSLLLPFFLLFSSSLLSPLFQKATPYR